jgi:hypothetical protein
VTELAITLPLEVVDQLIQAAARSEGDPIEPEWAKAIALCRLEVSQVRQMARGNENADRGELVEPPTKLS